VAEGSQPTNDDLKHVVSYEIVVKKVEAILAQGHINLVETLAERIAASCDGDVPPFLSVGDMAGVLAGAQQVVGLDTGFTHLAAALGRPTLGIYCDHDPGLAGITGAGRVASIGGKGKVPQRNEVLALFEAQMR
jgi:heptosyltransferase-1